MVDGESHAASRLWSGNDGRVVMNEVKEGEEG